ncbi:MAG: hypothetical protein KUG75_13540 [Pseudomonadales bacterium]|nr:hypothetical protein [Pseudomonadales bacterium]
MVSPALKGTGPQNPRNIILAAIPRSGSTLTCQLINQTGNCLAMIEPLNMSEFNALPSAGQRVDYLTKFFATIRTRVQDSGQIPIIQLDKQSTNTFSSTFTNKEKGSLSGRTSSISGVKWTEPTQTLAQGFTLLIKHPNAFSALLAELIQSFSCYALIRNPLAILSSWNTLDHPLRDGHAPMAEAHAPELQKQLAQSDNPLQRQLLLLSWYFQTYRKVLKPAHILKYEQIVASRGAALSNIVNASPAPEFKLINQNSSDLYDPAYTARAAKALLADTENYCWHFYQRYEIEQLANASLNQDAPE